MSAKSKDQEIKFGFFFFLLPLLALFLSTMLPASLLSFYAGGEEESPKYLTLERIFASQEFQPERFGPARWLDDGKGFLTLEKSAVYREARDLVLYEVPTGKRQVLIAAQRFIPAGDKKPLFVENYEFSKDKKKLLIFTNSQRVWRQNTRGDYWVLDPGSGQLQRLGQQFEEASLMFAKFPPDARSVAYVHNNNLYLENLDNGQIKALTSDGSGTIINGTSDWVYEEEFNLRDGFSWSPDGKFIAFWQFDSSGVPDFYMINNTDGLYPRMISFKYPKVGQTNSACRIGFVEIGSGQITWVKSPGDLRNNYIPRLLWLPDSTGILFQQLNRLQNENNVYFASVTDGRVRKIFTDKDEAWVEVVDDWQVLENGRFFTWLSERDGWRHFYLVSIQTGEARLITPGNYDVLDICGLEEKTGWIYFLASPDNATQRYLWRIKLKGKEKAERLTPVNLPGTHIYQFSPGCLYAIHTYSRFTQPPLIDVIKVKNHQVMWTLVDNKRLRERLQILTQSQPAFFEVDISNGIKLDAWMIKPPDFNPGKKYPLYVYVYGEPAAQTVVDRWGGNTYLWHLFLAQNGYVVASFDNRGTPAPRGREWRKCIYRQIGILASADQAAALKAALGEFPFLDPKRVGIWGWSGGGQMTLNMLFRYPDLYRMGIAVAFVSDQRLYDTIYQERYMALPSDNPEGYKNGSPITFAHQLKAYLLIIHGTGDDNVHYQSFEKLVNELIANNKLFWMMSYPNRSHGIFEGKNTTLHLYRTMWRFIQEKLPADR